MAQIISTIESAVRPAAKQLIKGGLVVTNSISEFAHETGEGFKGLVAEARTDLQRPRVSKISSNTQPVGEWLRDYMAKASRSVRSAAASIVTTANMGLVALVAWITGESTEQAQKQVDRGEKALERVGEELATVEAANVIETVLVMAA